MLEIFCSIFSDAKEKILPEQWSLWAHLHVLGMLQFMFFYVNQPSLPTPFYSVLVSVSVFMALSTIFHSMNSPDTVLKVMKIFLTQFFQSYFCLIGPFNYIPLYESLLQPWYKPLWLTGLRAPTSYLTS